MILINYLRYKQQRDIRAVIFIRDLDNQPDRREHIEQARSEQKDKSFEVIIGMADRMREAWVLNGFVPLNLDESRTLEAIEARLNFDPCRDSQRLRSKSFDEPDRARNPKVVVKKLTNGDSSREQKCWEETNLELLREKGINTGLTDYLHEVEERLVPIIIS